jgi:protein-S-isoprenylcysteine O-methyltransferase Ste14
MEPSKATTLVTTGANRLTRNPMYLGLAGILTAHAVARGSWAASLPVGAFVAVMDRVQVPAEEAALEERFGEDYRAYVADVPRWVDRRTVQRLLPT